MSINYKTFSTGEELDKAIATVARKAASLQQEIQVVSVGVLLHAHKHGDYTKAQLLIDSLGEGVRSKALVEWFMQFGGLLVGDTETGAKGFSGWQGAEYIKAHIDEAKAKMWWLCKPEPPFAGFDFETELAKLIKRAERSMQVANELTHDGKLEDAAKVKVSADQLDALRALKASAA